MKERPIIMQAESVRAILDGRKTQMRRVVKPQPDGVSSDGRPFVYKTVSVVRDHAIEHVGGPDGKPESRYVDIVKCPYGAIGDRLWVREKIGIQLTPCDAYPNGLVEYAADYHNGVDFIHEGGGSAWTPSIHMPRWSSRITLEITGVRVERVQDISEDDAKAEGAEPWFRAGDGAKEISNGTEYSIENVPEDKRLYRIGFEYLWNSINAKRGYGWNSNPFVWVIEFKRVDVTNG